VARSIPGHDEPPGRGPRHRRRRPAARLRRARRDLRTSDEHSRLAVAAATNRLGLGDKIRLIPGHCDPTVNLYHWYVCIRANRVEHLWPITARGAVY
jgi:3-hydroxy-D-aspartate aldolase